MIHARGDYDGIQDSSGKIPDDEPVFLIRGQDAAAYHTLRTWAALTEAAGGSKEIVEMVVAHAKRMRDWPKKKVADLPEAPKPLTSKEICDLVESYSDINSEIEIDVKLAAKCGEITMLLRERLKDVLVTVIKTGNLGRIIWVNNSDIGGPKFDVQHGLHRGYFDWSELELVKEASDE